MAKMPKKPKLSAPVSSWEKYDERVKKHNADKRKKEALIKKHRG